MDVVKDIPQGIAQDLLPPEKTTFDSQFFSNMYRDFDDPWGLASHYYEKRKRALLMASLPRERFVRAFEPGCATGELTALLAERCNHLLASDLAAEAVNACQTRLQNRTNVSVQQLSMPDQWPEGQFDLIVVSELAYYLDPKRLQAFGLKMREALTADGVVVLCHWKPMIKNAAFDGAGVHRALAEHLRLAPLLKHEEADFLLEVWSCDPRSVAAREGII